MLNDITASARVRATALTAAFGIVAGGVALAAAPAFAADEAAVDPSGAPAAQPTESATPTPAPAPAAEPKAVPEKGVYTLAEFLAGNVAFTAEGFPPGVELAGELTIPGGATVPVTGTEEWVAAADGTFGGTLEPQGSDWPEGDYTLTLTAPSGESATLSFTIGEPAPEAPEIVLGGHITNSENGQFTLSAALADGVEYVFTGFAPGNQLSVSGTAPSGEAIAFDTNELLEVDEQGNAYGSMTSTAWKVGTYTVTGTDTVTGESFTITFEIVADAAPVEPVSDSTAPQAPTLASTGADFGPAGIALAAIVAGAGALAVSRRFAK